MTARGDRTTPRNESRMRIAVLLALGGCGQDIKVGEQFGTDAPATSTPSGTEGSGSQDSQDPSSQSASGEGVGDQESSSSDPDSTATSGEAEGGTGVRFDIHGEGGSGPSAACGMFLPGDVEECTKRAPPDSFEPEVQWSYDGIDSIVTPLVGNLTDDNGDGTIDLTDTPDVVIVSGVGDEGMVHVLDGQTGALHAEFGQVSGSITPALGDIDGDGFVEILTGSGKGGATPLHAYEHDGTLKWASQEAFNGPVGAIALADLDNDGDVEIVAGDSLYDHTGKRLWAVPGYEFIATAATAADLDGDGDLEVVFGDRAFHHDGTIAYDNPPLRPAFFGIFVQVGNFDADIDPEIVVGHGGGIAMLEHDGSTKVSIPVPANGGKGGIFPGTVHDFDGDCVSEFALSTGTFYTVYEPDLTIRWTVAVADKSGTASGTAFDFLGDGIPEAIYADEQTMFVYNGIDGNVFMQTARGSGTGIEYPTVADVDNDGAAEIIVVSNRTPPDSPSVVVVKDRDERWIQPRRIWNQHTYHVTNVNEDGTIPQFEQPNWHTLNTFRTNSQIESGGVCRPIPPEG